MANNKDNILQFVRPVKARELPEEAYTAESIGQSFVTFFQQQQLTRNVGLKVLGDVLHLLNDDDKCEHPDTAHDYVTSFTNHGATVAEVIEGVIWVLDQMPAADKEHAELLHEQDKDSTDGKTIH